MAERRMFARSVVESARFLKMPVSSQALYFHLGLNADDDGVVEAYPVVAMVKASEDDLRVLAGKGFVRILNNDLVAYIEDWRTHNRIRADRKKDSIYTELLRQVKPEAELLERKERSDTGRSGIRTADPGNAGSGMADSGMTAPGAALTGSCEPGEDGAGDDRTSSDIGSAMNRHRTDDGRSTDIRRADNCPFTAGDRTAQCSIGECSTVQVSVGQDSKGKCSEGHCQADPDCEEAKSTGVGTHTDSGILYQLGREKLTEEDYRMLTAKYRRSVVDCVIRRILRKPYYGCLNPGRISEWCEEQAGSREPGAGTEPQEGSVHAEQLALLARERRDS